MSMNRSTAGLLVLACVGLLTALVVARGVGMISPREIAAPEGWAALKGGDADTAASIFGKALRDRPRDPVLHYGAGSAAYALGRTDLALRSLKKAVEIDPDFGEAEAALARVAYAAGDLDLAIRAGERAAALQPRDPRLADQLTSWRREAGVHNSYIEKPAAHFRILYEGATDPTIGDRVASVLERNYTRVGQTLNSDLQDTLTVVLYTNREFQDITRSPAWAAGGYDGRIRVAVGGGLRSPADLERVVTHELVHAMIASLAPRRIPAWLNEGLATHLESTEHAWVAPTIAAAGSVPALETLANGFGSLDERQALVAYAESQVAAEILCRQLGANVGAFLQMVGGGASVDQSLLAFQVQPESFHAEWRRRVRR
jgi:Tetratricopeptide repeat/Peptidase MA superfamily